MDTNLMNNPLRGCNRNFEQLKFKKKTDGKVKRGPYGTADDLGIHSKDGLSRVQELTDLKPLTNKLALRCLEARYWSDQTCSRAGITLVVVNPFKSIPGLYEPSQVRKYHEGDCKESPPHIFEAAESAYGTMMRGLGTTDQSIIVSGESGAGKTWTTRCLMKYLTSLAEYNPGGFSPSPVHCIEKRILDSNPILEAFGNATTQRNQNSSRFGKYIKLQFQRSGYIIGASIQTYLLEKTRVVHQGPKEKNFHIFYQMLRTSTPVERLSWGLHSYDVEQSFNILPNANITGEDSASFTATKDAMTSVGIDGKRQAGIFKNGSESNWQASALKPCLVSLEETLATMILAAILHLGNIGFIQDEDDDACDMEESPKVKESLRMACSLLGVDADALSRYMLLRRIAASHGNRKSVFMKPCGGTEAANRRDCVAKLIYSRLFDWLVAFLNKHTVARSSYGFIGLLDIYGFESFEHNSLEQLCINYANEKLQQHFIGHFLRAQQSEYQREGLQWEFCQFTDNQPCLEAIEGKMSVFNLLNEECKLNRPSNAASLQDRVLSNTSGQFITKVSQRSFAQERGAQRAGFIIKHYADDVNYTVDGLVEKNKDYIPPELTELLASSKNLFVRTLVHRDVQAVKKPRSSSGKVPVKTVISKFKNSLDDLMKTLRCTSPHYIRCIKPNPQGTPGVFESAFVANQLRACGVMATLAISRAGYPHKFPFGEFLLRYGILSPSSHQPARAHSQAILEQVCGLDDKENQRPGQNTPYMVGESKVFLQERELGRLEADRDRFLTARVITVQRCWRAYRRRRWQEKTERAATTIQAVFRGWQTRREIQRMDEAASIIQHAMLMYCLRREQERLDASLDQELKSMDGQELGSMDDREQFECSSVKSDQGDVNPSPVPFLPQSGFMRCPTRVPITPSLYERYSPCEPVVLHPSDDQLDSMDGIDGGSDDDDDGDVNVRDDGADERASSDREGASQDSEGSTDEGVASHDSLDESGDTGTSEEINVTQEDDAGDGADTSVVLAGTMDFIRSRTVGIAFSALMVALLIRGPIRTGL